MASKIITFYSYKGGVGRSMAMANIAVLLAQWGHKTLIIDWDLEAPGLENFYSKYIDPKLARKKCGLIDLLNLKQTNPEIQPASINWDDYLTHIRIGKGIDLDMITAGKNDDDFIRNVKQFDYNNFYQNADGGQYLEDLRDVWLDNYDFVLIDSRTGLTDSSGICSIHMPDILVLLFTPNEQSFNGIKSVAAKAILGQKQIIYDRFKLRTLPVPSRIENQETALLDEWMTKIYNNSDEMLEWLPKKGESLTEHLVTPAQLLGLIKIPYKTYYAYGEKLAVQSRGTSDPQDIGYSYETLAAVLANDFQNIDLLINSRDSYVKKAKGEDFTDDSAFRKKIDQEKEEKQKLQEQLSIKEKQSRKRSIIYRLVVVSLLLGIAALFYFSLTNNKIVVADPTLSDSLQLKEDYLNLKKLYYGDSTNQYDPAFNITMLKRYYQLAKNYQDSAVAIKNSIETIIAYKFTDVVRNYYKALPQPAFKAADFFADTISAFGTLKSTTPAVIQTKTDSIKLLKKITNAIEDSGAITVASDSLGFYIRFIEKGNYLIDTKEEYKNMENAVTALVSYDYKIVSFTYTPLKGTPVLSGGQKTVIEIFLCQSGEKIPGKKAADIINALQKTDQYTIYTRNNFKMSSDTTSPYYITENQVRYNGDDEYKIAKHIQAIINNTADIKTELVVARTPTKNYLSVFICFAKPQPAVNPRQQVLLKAKKY
ncbi:tyrosine-protein kinase family protein [Ferruginibacter profundus]